NGSWSQMEIEGALLLEAHISRGLNEEDSSFVAYRIVSGVTDAFPAELYIYADNGPVDDEWDAQDDFLKADTQYVANDTTFITSFLPQDQELIIVIKTLQGCYDQVRLILNPEIEHTALPLKLKAFTGKAVNGKSQLEWVVSGNGSGRHFEVERSRDGREFSKAGQVTTTARDEEEYYSFQEPLGSPAYYRLKMVNRDGSTSYSPVVFVKERTDAAEKLFIVQNPVEATLVFTYQSLQTGQSEVNVYNAVGVKVFSTRKTAQKGSNTYSINLDRKFTSGTYILEVVNNTERSVERFIRR
ncbi:MAG TPA: T9SS type A sorting domain-containing protein, partial [Chitinophagaceae bacterium]